MKRKIMKMKKETIRKKWRTPVITKLNVSKTSSGDHNKVEGHNGSNDMTGRAS